MVEVLSRKDGDAERRIFARETNQQMIKQGRLNNTGRDGDKKQTKGSTK